MRLKDLISAFEHYAPFSLQEDYDNSGIQYGDPTREISKGLVCIDITEAVVKEAIEKECDVIISHHPLIFKGIKKLTGSHYTERVLVDAIKNDICMISVHTNLDSVQNGVNFKLGQKIGLENLKILQAEKKLLKKLVTFCPAQHADKVRQAIFFAGAGHIGEYDCCSFNLEGKGTFRAGDGAKPFVGEKGQLHFEDEIRIETILPAYLENSVVNAVKEVHPYEEVAYDIYPLDNSFDKVGPGMIGYLREALPEKDFLDLLKEKLGVPVIRHSQLTDKPVKKVAFCGGSGSFLRNKAMASGADAFVTADIKYHDFFDVQGKMLMTDVGHYESEQFTNEILCEIVSKKFTNFALLISDQSTNPVSYY